MAFSKNTFLMSLRKNKDFLESIYTLHNKWNSEGLKTQMWKVKLGNWSNKKDIIAT